jgi:hypothetical protein
MSTKNRTRRTSAALLLLGLGLGALVALAPAATTVQVTKPNGESRNVDIANIPPDVGPDQEYVVRGQTHEVTGVSLETLLRRAGLRPRHWESVQVGPLVLTQRQYENFGDETPPAFFDDQGDATFIKPDRGGEDGEIIRNSPSVAASRYSVSISPADEEIDAGDSIDFTAAVRGGSAGGLKFRWGGTGLAGKSGRSVTYRFPKKGRKSVHVTVSREGTVVATAGTDVFVDRKPDDDDTDGDDGSSNPGTGGIGIGDTDTSTDSTDTTTTPSFTPPATTYDPPSTTPSTPPSTPASPGTTPDDSDPAPAPPPLTEVSGELLADTSPLAPAPSDSAAAGSETSEETADDPELAISGAVVAAGLAALLLGLGAGWEFERIHPRRLRRRPDLSGLRRLLPGRWR